MAALRADDSLVVGLRRAASDASRLPVDSSSFWNTTVGKVGNTVAQLFLKNDPDRTWSLYDVGCPPSADTSTTILTSDSGQQHTHLNQRFQHHHAPRAQHLH